MTDVKNSGEVKKDYGKRIKKALGDIVYSLINATVILIIIAAVVVIAAVYQVRNLSAEVASDATKEVMKAADFEIQSVSADISNMEKELKEINEKLEKFEQHPDVRITFEPGDLEFLRGNIDALNETISGARSELDGLVVSAEDFLNQTTSEIEGIHKELTAVNQELKEILEKEGSEISKELGKDFKSLTAKMDSLSEKVESLLNSNLTLNDQTIKSIGNTLTDMVIQLRNCKVDDSAAGAKQKM